MDQLIEKVKIIEYEKKIQFLEKKVSNLQIINVRLGETLLLMKNRTYEKDRLAAKKNQEIRDLEEKLEQALAKIPTFEKQPNPSLDDIPLDEILFDSYKQATTTELVESTDVHAPTSPLNSVEIFESTKIEIPRDENGYYQCDQCSYKSYTKLDFENHYRSHTGEEPFGCKLCQKRFKSKYSCIQHIRNIHAHCFKNSWRKEQEESINSWTTNRNLHEKLETFESRNSHIKRDANGYFQCDQCEYKSHYKSSFDYHHRIHTGEEPYGCKLCKMRFRTKSSCIKHIRRHDDPGFKPKPKRIKRTHDHTE